MSGQKLLEQGFEITLAMKSDWRIGTEHEKLVFHKSDHRAPSYDEPGGIRDAHRVHDRPGR